MTLTAAHGTAGASGLDECIVPFDVAVLVRVASLVLVNWVCSF